MTQQTNAPADGADLSINFWALRDRWVQQGRTQSALADWLVQHDITTSAIRLDQDVHISKIGKELTEQHLADLEAELATGLVTVDDYSKLLVKAMELNLDTDWLDAKLKEQGAKLADRLEHYKVTPAQLAAVASLLDEIKAKVPAGKAKTQSKTQVIDEDVFVSDAEMKEHQSILFSRYLGLQFEMELQGIDDAERWIETEREARAKQLQISFWADEIFDHVNKLAQAQIKKICDGPTAQDLAQKDGSLPGNDPKPEAEIPAAITSITFAPEEKPSTQPAEPAAAGVDNGAPPADKTAKGKGKAKTAAAPKPKKEKTLSEPDAEVSLAVDQSPDNYLRHAVRYEKWQLEAASLAREIEEMCPYNVQFLLAGKALHCKLFSREDSKEIPHGTKIDVAVDLQITLAAEKLAELRDQMRVCIHVNDFMAMQLRTERDIKVLKANADALEKEYKAKIEGGQFVYGSDMADWTERQMYRPSNINSKGGLKKKSISTIAGVVGFRSTGGVRLNEKPKLIADLMQRYEASQYKGADPQLLKKKEECEFFLQCLPVKFVAQTVPEFDWENGIKPLVEQGTIKDLEGVTITDKVELGKLYIEARAD